MRNKGVEIQGFCITPSILRLHLGVDQCRYPGPELLVTRPPVRPTNVFRTGHATYVFFCGSKTPL